MVPGLFFRQPHFGDAPVGSVLAFAGPLDSQSLPHSSNPLEAWGWMFCDGRSLPVRQYPELFAVLGYLYGGSDGNFSIPDLRGYFLRGAGSSTVDPDQSSRQAPPGGSAAGVGSTQAFALQTHEHIYNSVPAPATPSASGQAAGAPSTTQTLTTGGPTDSLSPPGGVKVSAHETRPVNVYVNYIIKFAYGWMPSVV